MRSKYQCHWIIDDIDFFYMSMYAWFPKENGNMPQAATHSDTNNVEEIPGARDKYYFTNF